MQGVFRRASRVCSAALEERPKNWQARMSEWLAENFQLIPCFALTLSLSHLYLDWNRGLLFLLLPASVVVCVAWLSEDAPGPRGHSQQLLL